MAISLTTFIFAIINFIILLAGVWIVGYLIYKFVRNCTAKK